MEDAEGKMETFSLFLCSLLDLHPRPQDSELKTHNLIRNPAFISVKYLLHQLTPGERI